MEHSLGLRNSGKKMAETFLILGSSSFYGRSFMECVRRHGDEASGLHRPFWALGTAIPKWNDYIVNFACESLVEESWESPGRWCDTNLTKTGMMFKSLAKRNDYKRFVHVSTPESYGHTETKVDESHNDWRPSTPYAVSRASADLMLKAYARAFGFRAIITRTANIYGDGQTANRIIPLALKHKREGNPISLHGGGVTERGFVHVEDACEATYLACKEGTDGETYHIATPEVMSIRALVERIGCPIGEDAPERVGKDLRYWLDAGRITEMGWKPTIGLDAWLNSTS